MTEEGREIQEIEEGQEAQEIQEVLEVEEVQDVPEAQESDGQTLDEQRPDVSEPAEPPEGFEATVESVIEAVLFASDEPLSEARLTDIVEASAKQVREHIENLNAKYQANNNAFRIEQIAGGYQMLTLSPYNYWLKKLLRARSDNKLSPAALVTLAIVA